MFFDGKIELKIQIKQRSIHLLRTVGTFTALDCHEGLAEALKQQASGFQSDRPAFFQWLGVVPYLTREAVSATLGFIARVPESEVVFDYAEPFESYPAGRREHVMAVAARTASLGEPWLSLFDPCELSEMLGSIGFGEIEDLGLAELTDRFYGALKQDIAIGAGPHVLRARRQARATR